jgi:hypothetical protein
MRIPSWFLSRRSPRAPACTLARHASRGQGLAWQAANAGVLNLALSTLTPRQRRTLAAAVPALDALARAVDRLAGTEGT